MKTGWGRYQLEPGVVREWKIGTLRLWAVQEAEELRVAFHHLPESNGPEESEPELPQTWSRWAIEDVVITLDLVPAFPDKSVVAHPRMPFYLPKNAEAKIYVGVPLWLHLHWVGRERIRLAAIPTTILSNTWFGTAAEGELCYWLSTRARRKPEPDLFRPHRVVCPVRIVNSSDDPLHVEEICLRVGSLAIFESEGHFWADETQVFHRGANVASRVEVSGAPPPEAEGARLVTPPREPARKSFVAKTFETLRSLPGLGIGNSQT